MKNILVPVDFSDATDCVIDAAANLAITYGAKLWVIHCVVDERPLGVVGEIPTFVPKPELSVQELFADEDRRLSALVNRLRNRGIEAQPLLKSGSAFDQIAAAAERFDVDLVVVGSHGHGAVYELFVGTVTQAVLQKIGRPTLVVPSANRREKTAEQNRALESAAIE